MDSSDWSNAIRHHIFDTRPDTEFKLPAPPWGHASGVRERLEQAEVEVRKGTITRPWVWALVVQRDTAVRALETANAMLKRQVRDLTPKP
jgi:hypothetical protein